MGLGQYIKDTRAELRHVAWPTRTQTIIYTVLVTAISIVVALYLGFFDFLFTTGLARSLQLLTGEGSSTPAGLTITQEPATTTPAGQ